MGLKNILRLLSLVGRLPDLNVLMLRLCHPMLHNDCSSLSLFICPRENPFCLDWEMQGFSFFTRFIFSFWWAVFKIYREAMHTYLITWGILTNVTFYVILTCFPRILICSFYSLITWKICLSIFDRIRVREEKNSEML